MDTDFGLESLVNLEQTFYNEGYQDGFSHGRIHGLIEGRALGREKGFEIWEELGFYEGFAKTWRGVLAKQGRADERASQHIRHLLDSVSRFPTVNPSASDPASEEIDIPKLLRQIRSRYKVLCSCLGVRPRPHNAEVKAGDGMDEDEELARTIPGSAIPVWQIDKSGRKKPVTNQDLSF